VYRPRTNDCDEEVEEMWKETTVGCCVALFELVFWRNWGNPQELDSQDIVSSGRASNPWPGMLIEFFGLVILCLWCNHRLSAGWQMGLCSIGWSVIDGRKLKWVEKSLSHCYSVRHKSHVNCYASETEPP
jgi:hypothetical protein